MNIINKTIVITGQTASGKDTVIKHLNEEYNISPSISFTTRPIRNGEKDGKDYYFVTDEEFDNLELPTLPVEFESIHNGQPVVWRYGTNPDVYNKSVILDPKRAQSLLNFVGKQNIVFVNVTASNLKIKERANNRGDEPAEFKRRFGNDKKAFYDKEMTSDFKINNNQSISDLYGQIKDIMNRL